MSALTLDDMLAALRGAGEDTRLRILQILRHGELAVAELTQVLGQSQPRVSRHLKLMMEAGLIERRREGSWAFFRLARRGFGGDLGRFLLERAPVEDAALGQDRARLERVRARRAEAAAAYFRDNARGWDRLRALHAPEEAVEAACRALLAPQSGARRFRRLLDLGVGSGRMLELFADRYELATGYDLNPQMLSFARARLQSPRLRHAELRQGDILNLPEESGAADAAICHQVLHFLSDPPQAIAEAARVLAPGGVYLIVDFAPHGLEFLREQHAHRRLGFEDAEIREYCAAVGLRVISERRLPAPEGAADKLAVSLWLAEKPAP